MMDGESSVRIEISDDLGPGAASAEAALRGRAKSHGDKIVFADPPDRPDRGLGPSRQITYAQANALADTLCIQFRECGLKAGDVIAIQAPNIIEAPLLILGAWRAGLIPCMLPLLWRLEEIHQAFSQIKPKAAVSISHYAGERRAQTLGEAAARQMSIRYLFAFGDDVPDGITPINDWLAPPDLILEEERHEASVTPDISEAMAIITWAVGKQGPYPVPRSHHQLMALAHEFTTHLKLAPSDVLLNTYPFSGIAALAGHLVAPMLTGCQVVQHLPFDFDIFLQQLEQHDVTYTAVPAPVISALEERHDLLSGKLRLGRLGCVWPNLHTIHTTRGLFETPVPIFDMYNFAELALMVRERKSEGDPSLLPLGKVFALERNEDDEDEEPVLETRVHGTVTHVDGKQILKGTLLVRGSIVPTGPYTLEGLDGEPILKPDSHGYLDTGIGCIVGDTRDGFFRCEKSEELFYHGGAVIAASELDELYAEFDEFLDAAAFALDDAVIGERIFAAVVPRPELSPSLTRLKQFLDEKRVASYKTPDQLVIVKSIPRSGAGAVLRDQILSQL